jgi:hypothetical protein
VLTDVGESTPHICAMLSGCDGLVLEFNHDAELLCLSGIGQTPHCRALRASGKRGCGSAIARNRLLAFAAPGRGASIATNVLAGSGWKRVATPDLGFDWRSLV